jgi:hypothetical protein
MTTNNQISSATSPTVPMAGQNRFVIVATTGMVGGYALRYALDNSEVKSVTSIGRKKLGISHPKLKEVSIRTSQTVCRSQMHPRTRMQWSIAWDLHRVGIGRETMCHNRRLHHRFRASAS